MPWGQIGDLRERVAILERDMALIRHWGFRAAILIALWAMALIANLSAETAAQLVAGVLKAL